MPGSARYGGDRFRRREDHARSPARPRATSPTLFAEQALEILAGSDELGLEVDLLRSPESEAAQPVPVLGLGEERLDPDLPFAHRLRVRLGLVVAAHPVQIGLVETAPDAPAARCGCALRTERADRTGRCWCLVDAPMGSRILRTEAQGLLSRTARGVRLWLVDKIRIA